MLQQMEREIEKVENINDQTISNRLNNNPRKIV